MEIDKVSLISISSWFYWWLCALNCTLDQPSETFAEGMWLGDGEESLGKVVACEKKIRFSFHIQKGRIICFI